MAVMALCALPAAARADDPPTQLLPDLVQLAPRDIEIQEGAPGSGDFQIGFTSIVGNVGDGPMEIHGVGPGAGADMTAYQVVHTSEPDTPVQLPDPIGVVHYEDELVNHNHWHFQPFDDYELRSLDGSHVYSDQKEGFCLINSLSIAFSGTPGLQSEYMLGDFCHQGLTDETEITEGISVGWADEYTPFRGGQDVDLTGVPAGRYYLVHTVNGGTHPIHELGDDFANDSATATVDLSWPNGSGALPAVKVLKTCLAAETCLYTDPPPPPPPAPPAPDTRAPRLLLGGASRQRFLRGRALYVYAKCDEVCTITASGRIAVVQVAKKLRTSSTKMTLKPGVRTKIKLPITARVRKLINKQLKRGARVTVRVSLVAIDASGNRTSSKRLLTLVPR